MNRLAQEISPYLLQHQHNPVDWYPWGPEAFAKAQSEDKPIFLSIGYATCHWCHVMEGDSFEKDDVATLLNQFFVPIKVDREERPDIDAFYMKAVQAMNQRGGWPLSVMLTPDRKPFWGGTFFPREQFKEILRRVAEAWKQHRANIEDTAFELTEHLRHLESQTLTPKAYGVKHLDSFAKSEIRNFDAKWGGFGSAPKFPPAMALMGLMRLVQRQPDQKLTEVIRTTLHGMAKGGMRDHVGGGFHRYSVDATWLVPHFEKMLYDNALLTLAYTEGYQLTGDPLYRDVVESTLTYVLRDMQHAEGGFYSAEDADSEKTEGKFYVWQFDELQAQLTPDDWNLLNRYFKLEAVGNFHVDQRVEELEAAAGLKAARNTNILHHQNKKEIPTRIDPHYARLLDLLLTLRSQRVRPERDDKILTGWNGLMVAALSKAYRALGHEDYRTGAERAASFLLERLRHGSGLWRSYRQGKARHAACLEDYAGLVFGLIELYQASFNASWLKAAVELQNEQNQLFWNEADGGYFETDGSDSSLLLRSREMTDHATPSGNGLSALNLLKLAALTGDLSFETKADLILKLAAGGLYQYPTLMPMMIIALAEITSRRQELVLAGDAERLPRWPELCPGFTPHAVFLRADSALQGISRLIEGRQKLGTILYYLCERGSCQMPSPDHRVIRDRLLFAEL